MYNEELEMLIDAALADGVLTDEEKQILFRKAQQYGVNLDEFEMVLEGRLAKVRAQRQQQAAPTPNKQRGPKKCPACGALIQSMQVKCPECGYEFHNVEANSTVKQLQQKLDEIEASAKPSNDKLSSVLSSELIDPIGRRKAAVIKSCPVPNSKDDLIELLTLCSTNYTPSVNDRNNYEASAWKSKYKQVRAKAKLLLKNDPDLEQVLLETDKAVKVNSIKKNLIWIPLLVLALALALIFLYVIPNFVRSENEKMEKAKTELSVTTDKVEQLISSGDYDQAATVLSLCKADVAADSETSALYSSMVMKVAGELLDRGDSTKAENLYNSAVAKLGSHDAAALDPLAKKLGIETKSMRKAAEQAEKDAAEAQSSSDNSADTVADESVSSSDDGEQSSSSKLKDKARNWLDKQIDKAADKMNKKIDKAADKMNKKIDKEIEKLAQ